MRICFSVVVWNLYVPDLMEQFSFYLLYMEDGGEMSLPMLAAFLLILYGIADSEAETVFTKAVNICMECIGIR